MAKVLHPDDKLKCLLVQPVFSAFSFWNYVDTCEMIGAKTPSPPLGLLTVAALLPQQWEFKLLDLNTRPFDEADWAWADIICTGGMLPQQRGLLEVIRRALQDGKYVAVGGADPSSQPDLYKHADVLVVGEGEDVIPRWLDSWRNGQPKGVFKEMEKPDVTKTPVPRYDLIDITKYAQIGVQYSRGCPFNCEFCDIIELYGRKPRTKTPEQMCAELDAIKKTGYSGSIDIVDDNFIGNKRNVKRKLLPALIEWNQKNGHPFFYATEASMNLGDDKPLLEQMRDADFRVIFMGIETPDPDVLLMTQKTQNTVKPIVDRVQALYEYGMVVTAGFIMGFDGEKTGTKHSMIKLVEDTDIAMAMIGLLVALPNTQLTRRLLKEGRLLSFTGKPVTTQAELIASARADESMVEVVDQTIAGINFVPTRDRIEIFKEYQDVVRAVFAPRAYFDRVMRVGKKLKQKSKHRPNRYELRRSMRGFWAITKALTKDPKTRWLYWRNLGLALMRGHIVTEQVMRLMSIYVHFKKQSQYLLKTLDGHIESQSKLPPELRKCERKAEPPKPADAAVIDALSDEEPAKKVV